MFEGDLVTQAVTGEDSYILTMPFQYTTVDGVVITVPQGFKTNFASVPNLCKLYIDDNSHFIRMPSVVHDLLYSAQSAEYGFTRKEADLILMQACIEKGMRVRKAKLIYYILRAFGKANYEDR